MSTLDSDDLGTPGYFLPEDSQFRLKKLRDQISFLSRLAQPRSWNEQAHALAVPAGELAICLESLAEQVALVLEALSWPAQRQIEATMAPESEVASAQSREFSAATTEGFAFGLSLDQFDALDRLIQMISAHGDVVACSHAAELAEHTLPQLGQAIHGAAEAVRALLHEVEAQPLISSRTRVGETRAVYRASSTSPKLDSATRLH